MVLVFSIFALFVFIGCLLEIIKYKKTNPFSKNTNSFSWKMALISILPIIIIQLSLNSSANQLFSLISLLFSFALASLLSFFIKPEFAYLKNNLLLFSLVLIFNLVFHNQDSINFIIVNSAIGLVLTQFTSNTNNQKTNLNLILPSLLYLTGLYWIININAPDDFLQTNYYHFLLISLGLRSIIQALKDYIFTQTKLNTFLQISILSLFSIGILFSFSQNIFLFKLSQSISWIFIFLLGLISNYIFSFLKDSTDNKNPNTISFAILNLLLIGALTLIASRLIGSWAWIILAISSFNINFVLFLLFRSTLQIFMFAKNDNLTGINLMHSYVSASLYFGFLIPLLIPLINKLKSYYLYFLACFIALGFNYFLHQEANASFYIAFSVGAILIAVLGEFIYKSFDPENNFILIWPYFMLLVSNLSSELFAIGNSTNRIQKLITVLICTFLSLLIIFIATKKDKNLIQRD